ncbi:hypothetical protein C8R47DRAFT_1072148 [Mycena vitilis]|nr:hypothetical protein C8R47DRAFT_1072148 [Mycena vitilis]
MPAYEILHSAEYWQTIRRAKAAREARKREAPRFPEEISGHWDGAAVMTFVPGNPVPYTSVLYANNRLIPVGPSASSPATAAQHRRHTRVTRPITKPPRGSNVIRRCQEREDAELLARLAAPRAGEKRSGSDVLQSQDGATKRTGANFRLKGSVISADRIDSTTVGLQDEDNDMPGLDNVSDDDSDIPELVGEGGLVCRCSANCRHAPEISQDISGQDISKEIKVWRSQQIADRQGEDLQLGERYANMDSVFCEALARQGKIDGETSEHMWGSLPVLPLKSWM